ncbi:DUF3626 domain-containing protein [Shewanella sp. HN-41]|uniref:DUF3626 domain-containing protein n=1 Tax=Shewanella sp. HN-41 TaxID=327275 RepID=UPI0002126917|nr:DUF3626 domain-containing protein [Shewanella sp. HN-41]EGM70935.1 hypothetical protein SOHN41_00669 [Shewanella sp. HN-41]
MTAIQHIERLARGRSEQAVAVIKNVQLMSNIPMHEMQLALKQLLSCGRIALHFHPDRIDSRGLTVAEGLLRDGQYRSQFETHISNGQLSPELGGPRDHWENQLFGNVYKGTKSRPKYGALDLGMWQDGPAPRFGSCYLLTHPHVMARSTFTYLDSYRNPKEKGTLACFDDILAALLTESFERHYALGKIDFKPLNIIHYLGHQLNASVHSRFDRPLSSNLDHYIEAQIHGDVALDEDIAILVADASFKGTDMGETLAKMCNRYGIELQFHQGFKLHTAQIPSDFRGPTMPSLASRIAIDEQVNAYQLGVATRDLYHFPQHWRDRGNRAQVAHELKLLWHVLVKYGAQQ